MPHGFQIDASLRYTTFRYNQYRQLDFNSVDASAGVSYHAEKLGGIDMFARYGFNELIGAKTDDVFFTNHTVLLGVQKTVPFSQAHYAYIGATGQFGFADPEQSERSELSAYAGYHLRATRNLEVDLLYRYAWLRYTEGDRADHNQTLVFGASVSIHGLVLRFRQRLHEPESLESRSVRLRYRDRRGGIDAGIHLLELTRSAVTGVIIAFMESMEIRYYVSMPTRGARLHSASSAFPL